MANDITISRIVANMALAELQTTNSFLMTANRGYEKDFPKPSYKQGNFVEIRKQNFANIYDGRIANPDDIDEETTLLEIEHQYNSSQEVTSDDLTLDMDTENKYFNERYIRPKIKAASKAMNREIAKKGSTQINYAYGSPTAYLNSWGAIDEAHVKLGNLGVDLEEAYQSITLRNKSELSRTLQNNFNDTLNDDISFYSRLGRVAGFDIFADHSINNHTTGTAAGTILVNGAVASGNTIVLDGASLSDPDTYKAGDIVSFAGVNSVNPIDKSDTGDLMQFVVQENVGSDGAGNVTITVEPAIVSDVASTRRNVTGLIPDNAAASTYGVVTPGTPVSYAENIVYPKRGLDLVVPKMALIDVNRQYTAHDKETNVAVRVGFDGDIKNDVNMMRIDILWGARFHGEYCAKAISKI